MARGIALSTAGVTVNCAIETEAGVRPTTGYKQIPDIKETPEFNPEPETHESTDLEQTEWKTYVAGLKDVGGALAFLANFTQKLQDEWETIVDDANSAAEEGKRMWFEIRHPKLTKSVYFPGEPASMGLPAMSPNGVMETSLFITPTGAPEWQPKTTTN